MNKPTRSEIMQQLKKEMFFVRWDRTRKEIGESKSGVSKESGVYSWGDGCVTSPYEHDFDRLP